MQRLNSAEIQSAVSTFSGLSACFHHVLSAHNAVVISSPIAALAPFQFEVQMFARRRIRLLFPLDSQFRSLCRSHNTPRIVSSALFQMSGL